MALDRVENAIERLTDLCSDMKTMLAAHEQRINQSEKDSSTLFKLHENRRIEFDEKIDQVYKHMHVKDDKILEELKSHRDASAKEHESLGKRMTELEKFIWIAVGGGITLTWLLSQLANYISHAAK